MKWERLFKRGKVTPAITDESMLAALHEKVETVCGKVPRIGDDIALYHKASDNTECRAPSTVINVAYDVQILDPPDMPNVAVCILNLRCNTCEKKYTHTI